MIPIDKRYNCEMMLKTGQYQTKEYQNKEDWWFIKYLKDKYKKEGLQEYESIPLIKKIWGDIYRTRFLDPKDADIHINSHFKKIYENASNIAMGKRLSKIIIYQNELDYINNMPAAKWFREFILLFLGHCKATGVYGYEFAPIKDYMKYLSLKTKNRDAITSTIYNKMRAMGLWRAFMATKTYWGIDGINEYEDTQFDFVFPVTGSGEIAFECRTQFELIDKLNLITDKYKCDICGREFVFGNRTQKTICDSCWKKKETKRIYLSVKKNREKVL